MTVAFTSSLQRTLTRPLDTVTATPAEPLVLPAASRATALSVYAPSATAVVSQASEKGGVVTSAPSAVPLILYCTPATPMLSVAFTVRTMVPCAWVPAAGDVSVATGAVSSRPPRSSEGTLTTKASSRLRPTLLDQMK